MEKDRTKFFKQIEGIEISNADWGPCIFYSPDHVNKLCFIDRIEIPLSCYSSDDMKIDRVILEYVFSVLVKSASEVYMDAYGENFDAND